MRRERKKKNGQRRDGVSLAEIIVSMVVLAVLAASASHVFANLRKTAKVQSAKSLMQLVIANQLNSLRSATAQGIFPANDAVECECWPAGPVTGGITCTSGTTCTTSNELLKSLAFPNSTQPTVELITDKKLFGSKAMQVIVTGRWTADGSPLGTLGTNETKSETISTFIYRT